MRTSIRARIASASLVHPAPADDRAAILVAHEDVLRHVEIGEDRRLLVDGGDPGPLRLARALEGRLLAVDADDAGVRRVDAGHDLDQRRLAGAVLAQQRVRLARVERQRDVVERLRRVEPLGDAAHLHHGRRRSHGHDVVCGRSTPRPSPLSTISDHNRARSRLPRCAGRALTRDRLWLRLIGFHARGGQTRSDPRTCCATPRGRDGDGGREPLRRLADDRAPRPRRARAPRRRPAHARRRRAAVDLRAGGLVRPARRGGDQGQGAGSPRRRSRCSHPHETVFLDSSSTGYFVARRIVELGIGVTVITNSLPVDGARSPRGETPNLRLIGVGGTLRPLTRSFVGPYAVRTVQGHFADRMFLSVKGVTERRHAHRRRRARGRGQALDDRPVRGGGPARRRLQARRPRPERDRSRHRGLDRAGRRRAALAALEPLRATGVTLRVVES